MDLGTIQWCKWEGVLIAALEIAGWVCFGLVEFLFCWLGAWPWIVADAVVVIGG